MKNYVGIPFSDGGRTQKSCDCWGLVKLIYKEELEIILPDFDISAYNIDGVSQQMAKSTRDWNAVIEPKKFDVIAMSLGVRTPKMVNHVGVYLGGGKFIHTMNRTTSMINRMNDAQWLPRIMGVYRWEI